MRTKLALTQSEKASNAAPQASSNLPAQNGEVRADTPGAAGVKERSLDAPGPAGAAPSSTSDKKGETPDRQNFAGRLRGNARFLASNYKDLSPAEAQVIVRALESAADHVEAFFASSAIGPKYTLDNDRQVFFYEQDHYYLSNFSAFALVWRGGRVFPTSEHAYQWEKFPHLPEVQLEIASAPSAHEAFKIAERNGTRKRTDWLDNDERVLTMRDILRAKAAQHEYIRRKLLQTGDRELIENSWRDDFWGWGPNRDGKNMLGRLWMEVRAELQSQYVQCQDK